MLDLLSLRWPKARKAQLVGPLVFLLGCSQAPPDEVNGTPISFQNGVTFFESFDVDGLPAERTIIDLGGTNVASSYSVSEPVDPPASIQIVLSSTPALDTYDVPTSRMLTFAAVIHAPNEPEAILRVGASSGSVTFTRVDSTGTAGYFTVTFESGQAGGSFTAPACHLDGG